MPQPYDYTLKTQNIPNPSQTFMDSLYFVQVMNRQQEEQERKNAENQRMLARREAYATLNANSSFADWDRVAQQFPEDREKLIKDYQSLSEGKRNSLFNAGSKALLQLTPGADGRIDPTDALATLEEYAAAAENGRDHETAKQFKDIAEFVRLNPAEGRNTLGVILSGVEPKRFGELADAQTKRAEAANAGIYYQARAEKERSAATEAESDAQFADERNRADIDWVNARTENNRSLMRRRDALPAGGGSASPRSSGVGTSRAPTKRSPSRPTATGPNGEKVEWNGRAWVPLR